MSLITLFIPRILLLNTRNINLAYYHSWSDIGEYYRDIHRYYLDKSEKYVYVGEMDNKTKDWHYSPKIILQRIVGQNKNKIFATIDTNNRIIFPNANLVNTKNNDVDVKFYLAILNSKLISYFYNFYFGESNTNLTKLAFESLPIPNIDSINHSSFIDLVENMLNYYDEFNSISNMFQRTIQRKFEIEELPKKIQDWYKLTYAEFIRELGKKKVKLTLSQEAEWEDYFLEESKKALEIKATIDDTDKTIDTMVYKLYGLNKEEIAIVEAS